MPVLVSQNFYRHGDRFREENGEKVDKFVTGEFVVHTVYGCQVVVTNPTSSRQRLTVLVQLPVGAIPLADGQYTKSVPLDLEPYRTQTVDYLFYFPRPGQFAHFPVHVAKNEKVVAAAQAGHVRRGRRSRRSWTPTSWDYVSQNGTDDEVLAFLDRENVRALNLDKIAFRMKDRGVLRGGRPRCCRSGTCTTRRCGRTACSTTHPAVARQFLLHADQLVGRVRRADRQRRCWPSTRSPGTSTSTWSTSRW